MTSGQRDLLVDRRRLKRRLRVWQVFGLVSVAIAVLLGLDHMGVAGSDRHIARLTVKGVIVDDRARMDALKEVAKDPSAAALIVRIDSPGGTVVGGEALFYQLQKVAEKKPVVAVMRELATSAAYMVALGTDRIIAREGSITGSIGVIMQTTDVTELLESIGIKPEAIKSSPLKAQPNPLEPLTPEARRAIAELIDDIYNMFVELVAERRGFAEADARVLADGRVFTGRQAIGLGLVDQIGGETEALEWLSTVHAIDASLDVRDLDDAQSRPLLRRVLSALGVEWLSENARLDGLVALWHPEI